MKYWICYVGYPLQVWLMWCPRRPQGTSQQLLSVLPHLDQKGWLTYSSLKNITHHIIKYHKGSKEILGYFQEWKINQGDLGDCKNMLTEPPFNKSSYIFLLDYKEHIVCFNTFVLISDTQHIIYVSASELQKRKYACFLSNFCLFLSQREVKFAEERPAPSWLFRSMVK